MTINGGKQKHTPKYNINLGTPGEYPQLIAKKVAMISFMAYKLLV